MAHDDSVALTIRVPVKIHEKFFLLSITEKPKRSMRQRLVAFMASEVGEPVPEFVDKRKIKRGAAKDEPVAPPAPQKGRRK